MPGENHLIELKEILYKDKVYKNEVEYEYSGFNLKDKMEVTYSIKVNKDDLMHLFTMTPYLYKTKIEDIKALDDINDLNITIDFVIAVWGK
jgi:23S rRNA (guanine745-N1)-methyltransferase